MAIAISDQMLNVKPQMHVFLWPALSKLPLSSRNSNKYLAIKSHFSRKAGRFPKETGALGPFAKGFLLFRRSKTSSIFRMKSDVGLLPAKSSIAILTRKKSKASATEALNVYAASETLILCFLYSTCFLLSLLAKENPRSS